MCPSADSLPPPDPAPPNRSRRSVCESRGYCGPFANEDLVDRFEDGRLRGTAKCTHCGRTVSVAEELEKWETALWRRKFGPGRPDAGPSARA